MPQRTFEGQLSASGLRFAIVVSRFNSLVTERLLGGALDAIGRTGGNPDEVHVVRVPGSWEQPLVVKALAKRNQYDAIICLGAVIRGDTPHFDYVASEAAKGIAMAALEADIPAAFGILTCDSLEQALDRAGAKSGNKGFEAAITAIEMADLLRKLRSE
ncbi:MAG: 6,7-dimethyl-8-ribityllumazine synthase [Bryobacterales bacterium]|jgi:6,7-dimethyl-8-ribityllumazine synthase|nr:6,7-dimethyl-8-ribityllumazine synthase [Bryobacterales bacterium]